MKSKRYRGTPELIRLAEALDRHGRREALTAEDIHLLVNIGWAIANNDDPRAHFYVPIKGAPPQEHRLFVAIHMLLIGDPDSQFDRGKVVDAWKLADKTVREILGELQVEAQTIIDGTSERAGLLKVIEWHRDRWLTTRRDIRRRT